LLAPWWTLPWVIRHGTIHSWIDLSFLSLLVVAVLIGWRELRVSYTTYLVFAALFFSSWGMLGSVPRFVAVVFPIYIVFANFIQRSRGVVRVACLGVSMILGAILFLVHSQWNWVA
jgi:hypothetical protein